MHDGELTQQERNHLQALERSLGQHDPAFVERFRRNTGALGRSRAERVWQTISRRLRPRTSGC
jgi:hypothetical protein